MYGVADQMQLLSSVGLREDDLRQLLVDIYEELPNLDSKGLLLCYCAHQI